MRWINLADKQPANWDQQVDHIGVFRECVGGLLFNQISHNNESKKIDYQVDDTWKETNDLSKVEWLDESAPEIDVPEGHEIRVVKTNAITIDPDQLDGGKIITIKGIRTADKWARELLAGEIEDKLENQHRATLKQVEDYIEPYWTLTDPYRTHRQQIQEVLRNIQRDVE